MDSGYYAAMTGLVARTQALDIAATNLANAGTPGYRAEQEYFRSVLLGPDAQDSQLGQTVNNFGPVSYTHLAALPVLLCPSPARYYVKRWLEPVFPRLSVVAAGEIPPDIRLRPVATVR